MKISKSLTQFLKKTDSFIRDQKGIAAVEFAIAFPILISLLLSGVEVSRYILLNQKLERASSSIADLTAREESISESKIADIFEITDQIMRPFTITENTTVIVSSIIKNGANDPVVVWQRAYGNSNTPPSGSHFGQTGEDANLPEGFIMRSGEGLVTAEVAHDFKATFLENLIPETTIYKYAIYRPRYGAQNSIANN